MRVADDDSTGKHKHTVVRARSAMLTGALLVGVCLGVLVSEKLYLVTQEADLPEGAIAAVRSRKLEVSSGGGGSGVMPRFTGKPRSELEGILQRVAPKGEVMIVISNINLINEQSLVMWLECIQRIDGLTNWLVVAIDAELAAYCKEHGINHYYRPVVIPDSQKDTGSNHAISAMKYEIIREFVSLGWDVLLSDVDIVTLQNPFDHLYRDSDVEGMTDGFDPNSAYGEIYGIDDATMGWSRYAQGTRHMAFNSDKLTKQKEWDQSVWNEFIFFLSHGDYKSPQVGVMVVPRVMDYMKFMNTKVLFKTVRHMPRAQQPKPVMHSNYHPDKTDRMRAMIAYYIKGDDHALDKFPGGSEPGSGARDELKQVARQRLEESGWTDEIRQLCREFVATQGADSVRHEDIVAAVKPAARAKVPDHLKAELLKRIRDPEQQLFFDEAAACIHLVEGRMITAVALPQPPLYGSAATASAATASVAAATPALRAHSRSVSATSPELSGYDSDSSMASTTARAFLVSEGPPVRHIRSSLDGAFTALHRSDRLVEVHCHGTGNMFVEAAGADKQGRKGCDPRLLGFFWTAAHFVMVTAGGLEGVQWYRYSPETHMVVLGFGSSGAKLQAIQFSKAGTLKLPLLDLTPPWGSPIRPVQAAAVSAALEGFSAARSQPARLVGPDTCWVLVLYGRVFCAHHDRNVGLLRLYRLFRDATSLAHQYEVYARQLELSVVDNVLLVHHIDSAVVMLVDILAAGPAPICSPLPLAVPMAAADPNAGLTRGGGGHDAAAQDVDPGAQSNGAVTPEAEAVQDVASPELPVSTVGATATPATPALAAVADTSPAALQLHYPAWLVDGAVGLVYRLQLDLGAVAQSQSDFLRLLAFLQRRRPSGVPRRDPAGLTLRVLRGLMADKTPLALLRGAFDVVNAYGGQAAAKVQPARPGSGGSTSAGQQGQGVGAAGPTASPASEAAQQGRHLDVYSAAFAVLRAQQAAPPHYLQAALAEFVASCHAHGKVVAPPLATLYIDLLLDQDLAHQVAPLLLSHPLLASVPLAEHVEAAAVSGRLPAGALLAEQLLVRLGAHEARCRLLLRHGRIKAALLAAKRHGLLELVQPALREAAALSGSFLLRAAVKVQVQRFLMPGGTTWVTSSGSAPNYRPLRFTCFVGSVGDLACGGGPGQAAAAAVLLPPSAGAWQLGEGGDLLVGAASPPLVKRTLRAVRQVERIERRIQKQLVALPISVRRLMAGGVAGAVSKSATAPLETLKMQLVQAGSTTAWQAATATWRRGGVLAFFRGNSVDVLRTIPSRSIELSSYEWLKRVLRRWNRKHDGNLHIPDNLVAAVAGGISGVFASCIVYPLETVRTRMAVGAQGNFLTAMAVIAREEGGLDASLVGVVPYTAIRLSTYDALKAVYPLEVARRRMMAGAPYSNVAAALITIVRTEGSTALFNGVWLSLLKQGPSMAITFATYERRRALTGPWSSIPSCSASRQSALTTRPPGTANGGSDTGELLQLLAGLQPPQQQKLTPPGPAPQQHPPQQAQLVEASADAALAPSGDVQRNQSQPAPPQDQRHQPPLLQQDVGAALRGLMESLRQSQGAAGAQQQQQQQQPATHQGTGGAGGEGFLVTLLQVLAAASHTGQQQPLQTQLPAASPQQLPRSTSGLALAPPMPMPLTQLRPWPANAAMAAAPALPANPQSIPSTWMHQPPSLLNISAAPSAGLPGIATASNADHAAAPDRSAASVQGGGSPSWRPPAGPSRRRCDLSPPFLIPPEAKRRRSGADAIYGVQQQQQAADSSAPPPQLAQQMAAAAATLAAAMAAGQGTQPLHAGAVQQPLRTQLPPGLQLASSPAAVMPPAIPQLASGLDFQAVLAAASAASNVGRAISGGPHRAAGSPVAGIGGTTGSGRHSNVHGYGVPVSAPEGMRRSDLVALYTSPREQVERSITNQTYILRLHVTTQMAQLLFPPRADLEAAHQAAAALEPTLPANSRLGGGSTYTQLFKQKLTVVDDSDRAWPVQYEGFLSSGQRHYRLTSGWVGLMRAQNVAIGDTLVLERWTDDKWIIHIRIQRKAELEAAAAQQEHDAAATLAGAATRLPLPLPPLPASLPPLMYSSPPAAEQTAAPDPPSQLGSTAAAAGEALAAVEPNLQQLEPLLAQTTAPDQAAQHNAPLQAAPTAVPAVQLQSDPASGHPSEPVPAEHPASGPLPAEQAALAAAEAEAALAALARPAPPVALVQGEAAAAPSRSSDDTPHQY
ncbi:Arabinosyltransferase RRA3 [Chlorella vulgaris]